MAASEEGSVSQEQLKEYAKKQTQKYEECKAELARASAEIATLTSLKTIRSQVEESGEEDEQGLEIKLLQQAIKEKCVENQKLTEESSRLTERTKALLRKYKELKKKAGVLAKQQPEQNGLESSAEEIQRLQGENRSLQAQVEELKLANEAQLRERDELEQREKQQVSKETEALREALKNFADGAEEHTKVERELRREITELKDLCEQERNASAKLGEQLALLGKEHTSREDVFKETEEEYAAQLKALSKEIQEKNAELASSQELSQQLADSQKTVDELRHQLKEERATAQSAIHAAQVQSQAVKDELLRQIRELKENRNDTVDPNSTALEDLRNELRVVRQELEIARQQAATDANTISETHPAQNETNASSHKELAVEVAKVYALTEMLEFVSIEKARETERAATAEKDCREMERKGIDLSKKFAQRYKVAKAKLQKETKEHQETSAKVKGLQAELEKILAESKTAKEESSMRIQTLEESIESLVRERTETLKETEALHTKELLAERSARESEAERGQQLAENLEALTKELNDTKGERDDLSVKLREMQDKLHDFISNAEENSSLPEDLDVSESVLCTITVRDIVWVCVSIKNEECRWFEKAAFLRKLQERKGSASVNLQSSLPLPLEVQFREQNEKDLQAAQSETATALSQIETLRGQLAQYKRRAQVALRKAQEDAGQEMSQRVTEVEALLTQVQAELVKVTQQRDDLNAQAEVHVTRVNSLEAELAAQRTRHEELEKEISELKVSLKQQVVAVTTRLEATHQRNLQEERAEFQKQVDYLRTANAKKDQRCDQLSTEIDEMHRAAGSERGQLQSLEAQITASQQEKSELEAKLESSRLEIVRLEGEIKALQTTQKSAGTSQPAAQETAPKENGDGYSIPLFFDSLRKQQEDERVAWQRERAKTGEEIRQLQALNEGLLTRLKVLEEEAKESKRSLQRQNSFGGDSPDKAEALTYLKNVVLKYVSAKDQSERKTLLPVLATMLQFSSEELIAARSVVEADAGGVSSWLAF